jgi:ribosomal protection tetracycline resistance protein
VSQQELNLGIVAHVDAGKTTLTERLLYEAGVVDELGSVDAGTTQTDSLALEQQRGITIRSAVASFAIGETHVNLIDTPGHPDFIAEVERVLSVLDGAVLVLSAVEGVQPQTRILMRALQRLRVPTLMFVNKTDRVGADEEQVLNAISERLTAAIVPMGEGARGRLAEVLAERDEEILGAYVDGTLADERLDKALASQTRRALVHPVFFGSALTGAGVEGLMSGIGTLLPTAADDSDGPLSATAFKIERGAGGEKIAYIRMFSGTICVRDSPPPHVDKVTAVAVFEQGAAVQRPSVSAGAVAKLWGLHGLQVGDRIGDAVPAANQRQFPPPTLEAAVAARHREDGARLRIALEQLAEQDPLINVRQNDDMRETWVSLYGEVQKEVLEATLAGDYGIEVEFREATPICVERPTRRGEALEVLHAETNPFSATIGLRVDPAREGLGIQFRLAVPALTVPLYVYKTHESFTQHMDEYVRETLREGLFGWQVTDCIVTMTRCNYSVPDGPPSRRGPLSTAADFRKLTPLVLRQALGRAGTVVCEPTVRARLEVPAESIGPVMDAIGRAGAAVETHSLRGELSTIETVLPAAVARQLHGQLSRLTGGEGVIDSSFAGYQPVTGDPPRRKLADGRL